VARGQRLKARSLHCRNHLTGFAAIIDFKVA
jgi:hypothetical protein